MTATIPTATTTTSPTNTRPAGPIASGRSGATPEAPVRRWLNERRIAGIGAIGFASTVLLTNVLQGALPAMNASAAEVATYLETHRTQSLIATGAFAFGAVFLLAFANAFYGRLKAAGHPDDLVWARLGRTGATMIFPLFAAVVVHRLVLLVGTDELIGSPQLVSLVWRFEMAAFLLNTLAIAAAVLGFGVAGARAGLLPRGFATWAPVAAVAGVATGIFAVAGLEGSPIGFGGIVPFLSWMVLLLTAGVRQLRSAA